MTPTSNALSESLSEIAPPSFHGRSETIAEISRKWLAGIDSTQFQACHEYLLAVRLARHMTKTDVVTASMVDGDPASGVSLPTVSKIESGTYGEPGFRTMIRLARGYGISVSSLERFFVGVSPSNQADASVRSMSVSMTLTTFLLMVRG